MSYPVYVFYNIIYDIKYRKHCLSLYKHTPIFVYKSIYSSNNLTTRYKSIIRTHTRYVQIYCWVYISSSRKKLRFFYLYIKIITSN